MSQTTNRNRVLWQRRLARGLSAALMAWWLFIAVMSASFDSSPMTRESWVMASMVVLAVVVTIVAWWRPRPGGALMILFGTAFAIAAYGMAGRNAWIAVLTTGVPFMVVGALFRAGWRGREPPSDTVGPPSTATG